MVEMNGWEMSLSWSKRGIWGSKGGRWWWVGESTVTKHQVLASAASPCPLVPVVLLSSCAPSTTQPLHHNFQPVRLRHHLFEASEHLNIETTIPFSSNRHPSLKEMKCSVLFRLPLNLWLWRTMLGVGYERLVVMRWDEASKEMFSIDSWEASGGSMPTCVYCNHRAFARNKYELNDGSDVCLSSDSGILLQSFHLTWCVT